MLPGRAPKHPTCDVDRYGPRGLPGLDDCFFCLDSLLLGLAINSGILVLTGISATALQADRSASGIVYLFTGRRLDRKQVAHLLLDGFAL